MATRDKQDTQIKIVETVATVLQKKIDLITPASSLEDLGADSLDKIEVVMRLEEQFNIQIDDDMVEAHTDLQQTIDYVHELCG